MTTYTPPKPAAQPRPVGPAAPAPTPDRPTGPLEPVAADVAVDALPLLDHTTRRRTISPTLARRGHYLALDDGLQTRLLPLEDNITPIGRGPEAAIRLDEYRVSRSHAVLVRHGRHFRVLDNRSSNGTFVNGRRVQQADLGDGDVIVVGRVVLRYLEI